MTNTNRPRTDRPKVYTHPSAKTVKLRDCISRVIILKKLDTYNQWERDLITQIMRYA